MAVELHSIHLFEKKFGGKSNIFTINIDQTSEILIAGSKLSNAFAAINTSLEIKLFH